MMHIFGWTQLKIYLPGLIFFASTILVFYRTYQDEQKKILYGVFGVSALLTLYMTIAVPVSGLEDPAPAVAWFATISFLIGGVILLVGKLLDIILPGPK